MYSGYFPEILFSRKKSVFRLFGYLRIRFTKNQFWCLVCSNIFTENALHSQATQFSIHFLSCKHVDNESIPHSFTKETKPSKKISSNPVKLRSHGGGEIERRQDQAVRSSDAVRSAWFGVIGAVLRSTTSTIQSSDWSSVCGRRTVARDSPAKSLLPLSLRSELSLLPLSLSLSLSRNALKWN